MRNRRWRVISAALVALSAGGCGSFDPGAEPPGVSAANAANTVPRPPCPRPSPGAVPPAASSTVPGRTAAATSPGSIDALLAIVDDYGRSHAGAVAGARVWAEPGAVAAPLHVTVGLPPGSDDAVHLAGLRDALGPEVRLDACRAAHTPAALTEALAAVSGAGTVASQSAGAGVGVQAWLDPGHVVVRLPADFEPLARRLDERYGDLVALTVGLLGYPDPTAEPEPAPCRAIPTDPATGSPGPGFGIPAGAEGVELALSVDPDRIRPGAQHQGTLTVTNRSGRALPVPSPGSVLAAQLRRPGEREVLGAGVVDSSSVAENLHQTAMQVGEASGASPSSARLPSEPTELAAGASTRYAVAVGTASCRKELGYTVPLGTYEAIVRLGDQGPWAMAAVTVT